MKKIILTISLTISILFGVSPQYEKAIELLNSNPIQAIASLKRLAKNGDIDAQIGLYSIYNTNLYVKQDTKKALYWIKKAAKKDPKAMAILGANYIQQGKTKEALVYIHKAAKKGDPTALHLLGALYFDGIGVEQKCKNSLAYMQKAANSGSVKAAEFLYTSYKLGNKCVKSNHTKEKEWLFKAAKLNSPAALRMIGYSQLFSQKNDPYKIKKNIKLAEENLIKSAELGDMQAAYLLGMEYETGWRLKKDLEKAFQLYQYAASNGHTLSQYRLGTLYSRGLGVKENSKKACDLFEQSSIYPGAAFNIAICYQTGDGRIKNLKKAHHYFLKAAKKQHVESQLAIAMDFEYGRGVAVNLKKARYWYRNVINNNYKSMQDYGMEFNGPQTYKLKNIAKFNLAQMLYQGQGGSVDKKSGLSLMKEAANSGLAMAQNSLGVFYINGDGVTKNKNKAIYWFKRAADQNDADAIANLKKLGTK